MAPKHPSQKRHDTSSKWAIHSTKSFLDAQGIPYSNRQLFKHFGVPESSGRRLVKSDFKILHNNNLHDETRGRKKLISDDDITKIERLLYDGGSEARKLPWTSIPAAAGVDFNGSARTIHRAVGDKDWRKCTTCIKGWVSEDYATQRVRAATQSLEKRLLPQDWEDVRFSNQTHFGFGPEGKQKVHHKPGERECPDCIQARSTPLKEDQPRCHAWAAMGYDFKSELIWYNASNKNGDLAMQAYIDQILEPVVKPWLDRGDQFVLEEDGAPGHGKAQDQNIIQRWKASNNLQCYFNTVSSPDLSPIENAWRAPKAHIREHAIWDDEALKEAAEEGWEAFTQGSINSWIHEMPQRLNDVLKADGQMTGY